MKRLRAANRTVETMKSTGKLSFGDAMQPPSQIVHPAYFGVVQVHVEDFLSSTLKDRKITLLQPLRSSRVYFEKCSDTQATYPAVEGGYSCSVWVGKINQKRCKNGRLEPLGSLLWCHHLLAQEKIFTRRRLKDEDTPEGWKET